MQFQIVMHSNQKTVGVEPLGLVPATHLEESIVHIKRCHKLILTMPPAPAKTQELEEAKEGKEIEWLGLLL